jgi:multidrug efflux pump subunit AcrB
MSYIDPILKYSRIFTLLMLVLPVVAGTYAYQSIPKEGEPEITAPIAIVVTTYAGASPGEIENLVTNPLEEALTDLKNVKEMRSSSAESVSVVVVEFDPDADVDRSIQKVREKVTDTRSDLPEGVDDPKVEEITLSELPILILSVKGDVDPIQLKRLAEKVADELELLPEVLSTDVTGGRTREIQVYCDPARLTQYGLTVLDVYQAIGRSDVNIPAGLVDVTTRRLLLRTLTEIKNVKDYERIPIIEQGDRVVTVGDVARVVDGHEEEITYSRVDLEPAVSIAVKKRTGANILQAVDKVRERVRQIEKTLPRGVTMVTTADQGKFVRQGFDIMSNNAVTGLLVVVIVLYFAMGLRNALITATAIPLSVLFTFIFMKIFGITNNNMVRFSLVLCIGMVVDNAIIVVENAYHHYQLGKDRITAVRDGVAEIAMPVTAATLTTLAAFVPVLLMTGTTGEYMRYLPHTVNLSLSSSLLVALVGTPLVLAWFMKRTMKDGHIVRPEENLPRLKRMYVVWVARAMNHPWLVVLLSLTALFWAMGVVGVDLGQVRQKAGAAAAQALAAVGLGRVEVEMFPDIDFDYVYITIETPPGTDVDITEQVAARIEGIVREKVPEAVRVVSTIGYRGASAFEIRAGEGASSDFAEITVELTDGKEYARPTHKEIQARIRPLIDQIPGANIRFRPLAWGPPQSAPIVVKILGPDVEELRRISAQVKDILARIPGSDDIKDDFSAAPPELVVEIDRAAAATLGVPLDQVATSLRAATAGLDVRDFRDEQDVSKKYDLVVRYEPGARLSPDMLDQVRIRSQTGALVPLANFARFHQGAGVNAIRHTDRRRVVRVSAQNQGRSAVEISTEFQEKLKKVTLPPGYQFDFAGDFQETQESFASLKLAYLVAVILIFTLLVAQFNSYFQPFAIMTALPLSVVGAMFGLLITGNNFSIMSFVGLVGLTGIVVNDSIVLVDCINRNREEGKGIFDAVLLAGQQRLSPILSTTITTVGGLASLAITDKLWEGLGVVIMFGISTATVLTLVIVPVMYTLFEALGCQVMTAFFGPRFKEAPTGRAFYYTRRRWAWLVAALILGLQTLVLAGGIPAFLPGFVQEYRSTAILAPTALKVFIEGLVFYLVFGVRALAAVLLLVSPSLLGLMYLMNRRSREGYFVDVTPAGLTLTSPTERISYAAGELSRLRYDRFRNRITFWIGRRKVRIRNVVETKKFAAKTPLLSWLFTPAPARSRIRTATKELFEALSRLGEGTGNAAR